MVKKTTYQKVYLGERAKQAHLLPDTESIHSLQPALCGTRPLQTGWLGHIEAKLSVCPGCKAFA